MKIYDLLDTINTWIDLYRETSEEDKKTENWQGGMLKVLAKLTLTEEFDSTPFKAKLENIINSAKNNETNQISYIYTELENIYRYFQENS